MGPYLVHFVFQKSFSRLGIVKNIHYALGLTKTIKLIFYMFSYTFIIFYYFCKMKNNSNNTTSSCINNIDEKGFSLDKDYAIKDEIASSGFNRLIRAERYGKQFLLKGLKPEYQTQPQYVALLQKEFEIALTLSHPNIARIYSFEELPEIGPCIVMEYVDGRPLDQFSQENPSAKMRQRAIKQMLDAMAYYHSLQVVHRDLKPSNILVSHNGNNIRIIDFGCSDADQYVALKQPSYTLVYASPEQIEGTPLDCRSDIYNFGRVLQQVFPHRYHAVKRRCCRHNRDARYPNAEAVHSAMFGFRRWIKYALLLLLILLLTLFIHSLRHFHSREFTYPINSEIVLRCKIENSQAVILGAEKVSGKLILPETIRYFGLKFPLTQIASEAFAHSDSLTHVVFPENIRLIDNQAFYHCPNLTDTITLPVGLDSIGEMVFSYCDKITTLVVRSARLKAPENKPRESRFHQCTHLHTALFESTVEEMCPHLLGYVYELREIYVAEGIDNIGLGCFAETYNLQKLQLPKTLRSLDQSAIYGSGIERLILPENLETLGCMSLGVLYNCHYLEVGPAVKHIDSKAFYDLKVIDTLIFRAEVPPHYVDDPFPKIAEQKPNRSFLFLVPAQSLEAYRADSIYARLNPQPIKE